MSSTGFEPESSLSGRRFYIQLAGILECIGLTVWKYQVNSSHSVKVTTKPISAKHNHVFKKSKSAAYFGLRLSIHRSVYRNMNI